MNFILWLVLGAVTGSLANRFVAGSGFGLLGNTTIGIIGGIMGGWLFGLLGISGGGGLIGSLITSMICAWLLMVVMTNTFKRQVGQTKTMSYTKFEQQRQEQTRQQQQEEREKAERQHQWQEQTRREQQEQYERQRENAERERQRQQQTSRQTTEGKINYYKILQVDPAAEPEVIAGAYRRLAAKYHPDVYKAPDATHKMQLLNEAYSILSDPVKRKKYDEE
jgi:uncharacterized membrane protein YeaQ/YmgE (transglycosylase-associated protein family)